MAFRVVNFSNSHARREIDCEKFLARNKVKEMREIIRRQKKRETFGKKLVNDAKFCTMIQNKAKLCTIMHADKF